MGIYAGLDVSDKSTHICVVDGGGAVLRREVVASDPAALARWLMKHCPDLSRVVLETGPLSTFLYHGLVERDVPLMFHNVKWEGAPVRLFRRECNPARHS